MAAKKDKKVEKVEAEAVQEKKAAPKKKAQKESPAVKETKAAPKKAEKVEAKPAKEEAKPATEEVKTETEATKEEAKKEKPAKKFSAVKPRPLPRPVEKSTLDLDDETRRLLDARAAHKSSLPAFNRIDSHKKSKLKLSWRKPRGHHCQMRRQRKAKGSLVKAGFGSPALVRGLHASGYEEVIVFRPAEVQNIKKTQAIRIGGTVGKKKQAEIEKIAKELNIKVLNPLNVFEEVQ